MQLTRTLLCLAVVLLLAGNTAIAQSGYSIQLAAYSSPATQKFFEALRQPVQQVKIDEKTYLYVIDGFVSYGDADKVRKMAVGKGFPDAIALKTASSRIPALKVKPYTGPADGDPVPSASGPAPATKPAAPIVSTPPPAESQPTPPTTPAGKQTPAPTPAQTYTTGSNPGGTTYTTGGTKPTPPPATPQPVKTTPPPVASTPAPKNEPKTQPAAPKQQTPARQAKQSDPYGLNTPFTAEDPNVNPNQPATSTDRGVAFVPENTPGGYDQNFEINENSVKALVGKGSITNDHVTQANLAPSAGVVFFDYNKAMLRPTAEQEMARLASKLISNISYTLEIRAHTDAIGPDSYNDELSTRRGKAAMIFLLRKGVPANRVTFKAFGEARPLADNTTPDGADNPMGRQINRRVELLVKDAYGTVVEVVTLP